MEERKQAKVLGKIRSMMVVSQPPQSRTILLYLSTHQLHLVKMNLPRQPNPVMQVKNGPQEEVEEGRAEGLKMQTPLPQDFQAPPPGGTETVLLREELAKAAEAVADEGESFMVVAVVTGEPTHQVQGPRVAVGAEWVAGVAETIVLQLPVATIRNPRSRGLVVGMVRTGPSTTQPGLGTEVKLEVKAQSMRKSPRGGGREARRLAVRVVPVTLVIQTRKTPRKPTPRMALIMPTQLAAAMLHLHHPEVPRPGSSPQGVCPLGGAGVEAVVGEVSTGAVAVQEDQQEDTEWQPTQALMEGPLSCQPQPGNISPQLRPLGPENLAVERRRTSLLMEARLRVRGSTPLRHLYLLQPLPLKRPLKMEGL